MRWYRVLGFSFWHLGCSVGVVVKAVDVKLVYQTPRLSSKIGFSVWGFVVGFSPCSPAMVFARREGDWDCPRRAPRRVHEFRLLSGLGCRLSNYHYD